MFRGGKKRGRLFRRTSGSLARIATVSSPGTDCPEASKYEMAKRGEFRQASRDRSAPAALHHGQRKMHYCGNNSANEQSLPYIAALAFAIVYSFYALVSRLNLLTHYRRAKLR